MQKYLFFYLKTGGGHLAPAKSVSTFLTEKNPEAVDIQLVDGLNGGPAWLKTVLEGGYRKAQAGAQWTFEAIYALNKIPFLSRITAEFVSMLLEKNLTEAILNSKPDKIVIYHFLLIKPILKILAKLNLQIPIFTVVTDPYTAHPIWFLDNRCEFIVFSNEVKSICAKNGIAADKIHVFPFIIDKKFTTELSAEAKMVQKERFGLTRDKTILIMGGGDGMKGGSTIVKKLLKNSVDANIIIVCGRNERLFRKSTEIKQRYQADNVLILGFVDFVYELINVSDVVITKCGASTFMEILHLKKIPVISNYIWEQEKGNMEFVVNNGMGIFEKKLNRLIKSVNTILADSSSYQNFVKNINAQQLSNGTPAVAEFIKNY